MQGEQYPLVHTGMAHPFVTAARNQFIEAFEPAKAATSIQIDEGRIDLLADG